MISNDLHRRLIARGALTVRVLWLAFVASTVFIPLVVHFALSPRPGGKGASGVLAFLPLLLVGEAVLLLFASIWCRFRFPATRLQSPSLSVASLFQGYVAGHVLAYTLAEAICISGVVLYVLGIPASQAAPYAVVAIALVLLEAPRGRDLPTLLEQARARRPEMFS